MDQHKRPAGGRSPVSATRRARHVMSPAQRRLFLDELARSGDPEQSANVLGVSLMEAFRLRDADPAFGAGWQAAVGFAWELLEMRLLAELLADPAAAGVGATVEEPAGTYHAEPAASSSRGPARSGRRKAADTGRLIDRLDSRMAMAIMNRREPAATRSTAPRGAPMDSAAVARLRAELRDLAEESKGGG